MKNARIRLLVLHFIFVRIYNSPEAQTGRIKYVKNFSSCKIIHRHIFCTDALFETVFARMHI